MKLLHADHVLLGDAAPIADGAVVVDEGGAVVDVGKASDLLPSHAGVAVERVRGVVFPGLVNAHTHLELSAMRGKVPGGRGFVPWVEGLITQRPEVAPEDDSEAIALAVDELVKTATVAVGEITNSLAAVRPLVRRGIGGCVFHEVFGIERTSVLARVEGLRAELEARIGAWPSTDLTYAPAPHTLYTTHADAVTALLAGATKYAARTSLHLAEHAGERRAIEHGDGPVPEWLLSRVRQSLDAPKLPLLDYAERLGALSPNVLLVHLTEARPDELARVAKAGAPVVLCPRSNLFIAAKLPPLLAVLEAGIEPALGTDSLASNTSLDVLAEAKALRDRFPSVAPWRLVAMATWNGARALGRSDLGRIAKGTRPGIFAVEGDLTTTTDPALFLLTSSKSPRRMVAPRRPTLAPRESST